MRISVELLLSQGVTPEAILEDYPELEPEDIRACTAYAHALDVGVRNGTAGLAAADSFHRFGAAGEAEGSLDDPGLADDAALESEYPSLPLE